MKKKTESKQTLSLTMGDRIKYARAYAGMSQEDFAKILGIGQTTMSNLEQGKSVPDYNVLKKIQEVTGWTYDWIFNGNALGETTNQEEKAVTIMQIASINNLLTRLDPNQLTFIRQWLELYIKSIGGKK